jgi:hypothetical protein
VRDWSQELNDAERAFDQALRLVEQNEGAQAEALLELVIRNTRTRGDGVLLTKALCVLGEWLLEQGRREEGRERLIEALEVDLADGERVAVGRDRAQGLLRGDGGSGSAENEPRDRS